MYFKKAMGIILLYDPTNQESFDNLEKEWKPLIAELAEPNACVVLVANKKDISKKIVNKTQGKSYADESGWQFFETSTKKGNTCVDILTYLGNYISWQMQSQNVESDDTRVSFAQRKETTKASREHGEVRCPLNRRCLFALYVPGNPNNIIFILTVLN